MKLPDSIKVGGRKISVVRRWSSDILGGLAQYNDWKGEIAISKDVDVSEQQVMVALIHEILECLNARHEYQLEHHVIQSLAETLYQVIVDNYKELRGGYCAGAEGVC